MKVCVKKLIVAIHLVAGIDRQKKIIFEKEDRDSF